MLNSSDILISNLELKENIIVKKSENSYVVKVKEKIIIFSKSHASIIS